MTREKYNVTPVTEYSSHHCFHWPPDEKTSCLLFNLCVIDGVPTYFQQASAVDHFDVSSLVSNIMLHGRPEPAPFGFRIVTSPVLKNHTKFRGLFAFNQRYTENWGHIVGDDIFPVFNALLQFDLLTRDFVVVQFPKSPAKFNDLWSLVSQHPVRSWTEIVETSKNSAVCFDTVVTGFGGIGYGRPMSWVGNGHTWEQFRDFCLGSFAIEALLPNRTAITVVNKSNRRFILNVNEILDFLKNRYPDANVRSVIWDEYSLKEQLQIAASTSILVAVPGTSVMMAMFLPTGATLITICQWIQAPNCGNEARILWNEFGHIRQLLHTRIDPTRDLVFHPDVLDKLHISELEKQSILEAKPFRNGELSPAFWEYWGSTDVRVNLSHFEPLMARAVLDSGPHRRWPPIYPSN